MMVEIVVKMHDEENQHQVLIMSKLMVSVDQTINIPKLNIKFRIDSY